MGSVWESHDVLLAGVAVITLLHHCTTCGCKDLFPASAHQFHGVGWERQTKGRQRRRLRVRRLGQPARARAERGGPDRRATRDPAAVRSVRPRARLTSPPVHRPTSGGGGQTATYDPATLCCPRAVRLLPRHLALVDERSRQRAVPATRERRPPRSAPARPLPLTQGFTVHDRVVAEACVAPAASPHASSLRRPGHVDGEIAPRRADRSTGVPTRSMPVSAVRPTGTRAGAFAAVDRAGTAENLVVASVTGARMAR